jgi:hypothetical protein
MKLGRVGGPASSTACPWNMGFASVGPGRTPLEVLTEPELKPHTGGDTRAL